MNTDRRLHLGKWRALDERISGPSLPLPAHHLVTHGVVVGMTGSGKTGLLTVIASLDREERQTLDR